MQCPVCQSVKVFLCSGGYYICNECDWHMKKEKYDAQEGRRDMEVDEQE